MSKHYVTLVFEDGRSERIHADENDTIYMACLRNKIRILTDCLEGACATCKAHCVEGDYDLDDISEEALSEGEAAEREVLTCQMHARSDCVIEFPYESRLAIKQGPKIWNCEVVTIEQVSSTVERLDIRIVTEDDDVLGFLPGQYVNLSVPGTKDYRSYSFANPPHQTGVLRFFIKVLEHGVMSDYVRERAEPGDLITMKGPFGHFYLREPIRPIVMVAGGTGLAPMLSMFDQMVEIGATTQPINLLVGANEPSELFSMDLFEYYKSRGLTLKTEIAVVNANPGWSGYVGHVTDLLREDFINSEVDIYLCGPPPMIEAAESWLSARGVNSRLIHSEKFLPSSA